MHSVINKKPHLMPDCCAPNFIIKKLFNNIWSTDEVTPGGDSFLLLQDGSYILLQDGSKIILG